MCAVLFSTLSSIFFSTRCFSLAQMQEISIHLAILYISQEKSLVNLFPHSS